MGNKHMNKRLLIRVKIILSWSILSTLQSLFISNLSKIGLYDI